ncbi:MAG: hypothetical protein KA477_00005 [Candidatus Levybacteria bacterium]|jgi:hypothetical protein|nr:hypothetical protein [Candidatus Levybacteria bacterium]
MSVFDYTSDRIEEGRCISCRIMGDIDIAFMKFAHFAADKLSIAFFGFFVLSASLYFLWKINQQLFSGFKADPYVLFRFLCLFTVTSGLFSMHGLYWDYVFIPVKDLLLSAPVMLLENADVNMVVPGLIKASNPVEQMLGMVDFRMRQLTGLGDAILRGQNLYMEPQAFIMSLILKFAYFIVWVYFILLFAEGLIKISLIGAISPIFIICATFPAWRGISYAGLRILFNAGLQLFLVVLTISFSIFMIGGYEDNFPITSGGDIIVDRADEFIEGTSFLFLLFMAPLTGFILRKAQHIASVLAGGIGDLGAASGVTALIGGGMGLAGSQMYKYGSKELKKAFRRPKITN